MASYTLIGIDNELYNDFKSTINANSSIRKTLIGMIKDRVESFKKGEKGKQYE